jgi:hypothetical protein
MRRGHVNARSAKTTRCRRRGGTGSKAKPSPPNETKKRKKKERDACSSPGRELASQSCSPGAEETPHCARGTGRARDGGGNEARNWAEGGEAYLAHRRSPAARRGETLRRAGRGRGRRRRRRLGFSAALRFLRPRRGVCFMVL